jgi:hypothetical protein
MLVRFQHRYTVHVYSLICMFVCIFMSVKEGTCVNADMRGMSSQTEVGQKYSQPVNGHRFRDFLLTSCYFSVDNSTDILLSFNPNPSGRGCIHG